MPRMLIEIIVLLPLLELFPPLFLLFPLSSFPHLAFLPRCLLFPSFFPRLFLPLPLPLVCCCPFRLRTRGKTEDAGLVLEDYSFRFIDLQCPELAVDLGCMLVKLYDDCNFACTDERIDAIENLLERCPSNCTPERYRLLNKAIKWAATAEDQSTHDQRRLAHAAPVTSDSTTLAGVNASTAATTAATSTGGSGRSRASVRLHRIAAHIYERDGNFGNAQGHLVFCGDGKALANLVRKQSVY
eukprot:GHVT01021095.1.p1 GENE.GHVT01021095.1~~GHVT01021095.1.p1  ORF type:complete len:242 (+),score=31.67 GHVT01021095.1:924-1649(+)